MNELVNKDTQEGSVIYDEKGAPYFLITYTTKGIIAQTIKQ